MASRTPPRSLAYAFSNARSGPCCGGSCRAAGCRHDWTSSLNEQPMSAARRSVVNLFLVVLIGGSLYDIVSDQEHWPFSQYPMFSGIWRDTSFSWYRLVGVRDDGRELTLDRAAYIRPFDQSRMHLALVRLARGPDAARVLRNAVANCLDRYERMRQRGQIDGPPLRGMRLYLFEWRIDPLARNVDSPDRRQLIAEVSENT